METRYIAEAAVEITKMLLGHGACIVLGVVVGMAALWGLKRLKLT